jgi:hypothetical protein
MERALDNLVRYTGLFCLSMGVGVVSKSLTLGLELGLLANQSLKSTRTSELEEHKNEHVS